MCMNSNFDPYLDTYYESINGTLRDPSSRHSRMTNYGSLSTFIRGCLVLLLRAGFMLIQLGSIPVESIYIIIMQNIVDIAVSIASFGLVGYIFAFGYDALDGLIGQGKWIVSKSEDLDVAVLGFCACIIATGIITTILSGRVHLVGYVLINLLFSMIFQPIVMHWVWHNDGWMRKRKFLDHQVSVKDHGGDLVIHVTAGSVGLIGAMFLGRRLIKLSDIDESSIGPESPSSTITGYIFIALGLIGLNLPSPSYEWLHVPDNYIGIVLVNNMMAMASGIITVVVLQLLCCRETFNYWIILRCMQGAIAGMVSIAAGIDVYNPLIAYGIAALASVLFYFTATCMHSSAVEDYCNIIAIHLVCGIVGSMLPPLLGISENLGSSTTFHIRIIHLGWQLISLLTITAAGVVVFVILFLILQLTGFLRNKSEEINHRRGLTVAAREPERCVLQRLFAVYSTTPYIEPGTVGKSPEQINSFRKTDFAISSVSTDTKVQKTSAKHSAPTEAATTIPKLYEPVPSETVDVAKIPRFIYTTANNALEATTKNVHFDTFESSGDAVRRNNDAAVKQIIKTPEVVDSPEKFHEIGSNAEKSISHYELHRTRKYTNLFRDRRVVRKRGLASLQDLPKADLSRSTECILYDSKHNDGFITIKMPPKKAIVEFSDASDS